MPMTSEPLDLTKSTSPHFPFPFGGITTALHFESRNLMLIALMHLGNGCGEGHEHNIAVQFDGDVIWTSDIGVKCLEWVGKVSTSYTLEQGPGEEIHEVSYGEN